MSKKIIYDESLDSEIQFKKFVATQAPENHEISDEDVVKILGHRAPGEEYTSVHPPLEEMDNIVP